MGACIIEGKNNGASGSSSYTTPLGAGFTFNVSNFSGYKNFTEFNFRISGVAITTSSDATNYSGDINYSHTASPGTLSFAMSYNQSTGILTISGSNTLETSGSLTDSSGNVHLRTHSTTTAIPYVELITNDPIQEFTLPAETIRGKSESVTIESDVPLVTSGRGRAWGTVTATATAGWSGTLEAGQMFVGASPTGSISVNCFMSAEEGDSDTVTRYLT